MCSCLEGASFLLLSFHQTIQSLLLSHIKLLLIMYHLQQKQVKLDGIQDWFHLVKEVGLLCTLALGSLMVDSKKSRMAAMGALRGGPLPASCRLPPSLLPLP